jgi:hypothetical protein
LTLSVDPIEFIDTFAAIYQQIVYFISCTNWYASLEYFTKCHPLWACGTYAIDFLKSCYTNTCVNHWIINLILAAWCYTFQKWIIVKGSFRASSA